MKIAITDIYGNLYAQDRLFNNNSGTIGENLLLPGIELKKALEAKGHEYHTLDVYDMKEVDVIIFQEVPKSWYTLSTIKEKMKYLIKGGILRDNLLYAVKMIPKEKRILLIMEPEVVASKSYNRHFHKYFGKVITWNDDLIDEGNYCKIYYPQPKPEKKYYMDYGKKRKFTMICGNKQSNHPNELYSKRREIIDYFENKEDFDLYGIGWEKEKLKNYRGKTEKKLYTLSHYKYAFCFENQCNVRGYITEKIFDCFFANCIPIYWGAENIESYIPTDTFIDWRKYDSLEKLLEYLDTIDEITYNKYLEKIKVFLNSEKFEKEFSVKAYIESMEKYILS